MKPQQLLARLDALGHSLAQTPRALALLGLGSVGLELDRLDEYSDLDFFVIVEAGHKRAFLDDLGWLSAAHPLAYTFPNTPDGYKALFADGIFCEFAVFEPHELETAAFAPGRLVWKRPGVPESIAAPGRPPPPPQPPNRDHALGEALTNLYVGLLRDRRGEKLSAARFIQGYAVDRLMALAEFIEPPQPGRRDPFAHERRFEQRHPALAREAALWMQGYDRNRESALAILGFLEQHFEVDRAIAAAIRGAAEAAAPASNDAAEAPQPDLLDRLLGHDAWTTARILDGVAALPDELLDQDFDLGHRSVRETLRHMAGNIEVWTDLMAERPVRAMPQGPQTAAALRTRFQAAYADFGALARRLRDSGRMDGLYTDVLDNPPRQKSFGGSILHVITHNHQHRAELLHLLARLGVSGLIEGDMLSWEAADPPGGSHG